MASRPDFSPARACFDCTAHRRVRQTVPRAWPMVCGWLRYTPTTGLRNTRTTTGRRGLGRPSSTTRCKEVPSPRSRWRWCSVFSVMAVKSRPPQLHRSPLAAVFAREPDDKQAMGAPDIKFVFPELRPASPAAGSPQFSLVALCSAGRHPCIRLQGRVTWGTERLSCAACQHQRPAPPTVHLPSYSSLSAARIESSPAPT